MADPMDGSQGAQSLTKWFSQQGQWAGQLQQPQTQWFRAPAHEARRHSQDFGSQYEPDQRYEQRLETQYEEEDTQAAPMSSLTNGGQGAQSPNEEIAYTYSPEQQAGQSKDLPRQESRRQNHRDRRTQRHKSGQVGRGSRGGNHNTQAPRQVAKRSQVQENHAPHLMSSLQRRYPPQTDGAEWSRVAFSAEPSSSRDEPKRHQDEIVHRPFPRGGHFDYFIRGRVFKMPTTKPVAPDFNRNKARSNHFIKTSFGLAYTKEIHYIVCRVYEKSCDCLAYHTYGGKGLNKPDMSVAEAQNHAVVHAAGVIAPTDPKTSRQPIAIVLDSTEGILDKSRLDIRRFHNIEMNVPVVHVGMLAHESWNIFFGYVRETLDVQLSQLPVANGGALANPIPSTTPAFEPWRPDPPHFSY